MSKLLKFLVHTIIIGTILCVLAIFLPPLFGIKTTVMDGSYTDTNLLLGSVTYSEEVSMGEIRQGDSLTVTSGTSAHRYEVLAMDSAEGTATVADPTIIGGSTQTLSVKNGAWRALFSVEVIGYLLVAVQSKEGLIILGVAVLILIILYIIAELLKKAPKEQEEEELPDHIVVKSEKELKAEDKERERQRRAEEKEYLASKKRQEKEEAVYTKEDRKRQKESEKARRKEEKRRRKGIKTVRTGGFIDEIEEEDLELEDQEREPVSPVQMATSEAHEELKKEIAAATAEEEPVKIPDPKPMPERIQKPIPPVQEEPKLPQEPVKEQKPEPVEIKKMAVPLYTAAELADKVRASGDVPDVMRDEISKVVLFDYSDIIAGMDESK